MSGAHEHGLSNERARISVLGGGAWGTALALHAGRKGHDVLVWAREPEVVESINNVHENTMFFKVSYHVMVLLIATVDV